MSEKDVDRAVRRLLLARWAGRRRHPMHGFICMASFCSRHAVVNGSPNVGFHALALTPCRMALGHFPDPRDPNPYSSIPPSVIGSPEHVALAREAAAKSFVLLKNEPPLDAPLAASGGGADGGCSQAANRPGLLPLRLERLRRLTMLGPFANRTGAGAEASSSLAVHCSHSCTLSTAASCPLMHLQSPCWDLIMAGRPGRCTPPTTSSLSTWRPTTSGSCGTVVAAAPWGCSL